MRPRLIDKSFACAKRHHAFYSASSCLNKNLYSEISDNTESFAAFACAMVYKQLLFLDCLQPCEKVIAIDCSDDVDALEALRLQIDQELLDISFLSEGESLGRREVKKTASAPDLRNLQINVTDLETSSVCTVDDLSQGSVGVARSGDAQRNVKGNLKLSKEWLETFL